MVGLSGSVSESTVVEAPEKSVGRVRLVLVFRKRGGVLRGGWDSKEESWICVVRESEEWVARNGGEGGRHKAHSKGRTCVQRTDLGPWASQKWVRAIYLRVSLMVMCVVRLRWRVDQWSGGRTASCDLRPATCELRIADYAI